ncbi:MAG: 2,3-bisphosphoglycerate-independent phosphoglycerate mutase [bacterium]|nr:2,3-bisphosphoglycerate-independent phosphoglycerate mutase [bacterium]
MATSSRIVFLVLDGLGDIQGPSGQTPLEAAHTPHLDRLAAEGCGGQFDPVAPAITPGSGPGHLGLFGYDPLEHQVGRGVLAALGIGFPLQKQDVAARFNYCSLNSLGEITDRRAGRLPTAENERLTELLKREINVGQDGVELHLQPVSEHRGLLVLRGEGLGPRLDDTDPQIIGQPPLPARARDEASSRTAEIVDDIVEQVKVLLRNDASAQGMLLRGFDSYPSISTLPERFKLKPLCIAQYPMYKGLARLVGMEVAESPASLEDFPSTLGETWDSHDFFFCHVKYTDKAGEDGDFERKREVIENVDSWLPKVVDLKPDVLVVTADHSTPAALAAHSWHPVPSLIWAPGMVRQDEIQRFDEHSCAAGGLGRLPLRYLLPIAMANAGKLKKYGA